MGSWAAFEGPWALLGPKGEQKEEQNSVSTSQAHMGIPFSHLSIIRTNEPAESLGPRHVFLESLCCFLEPWNLDPLAPAQ